MKSKAMEKKKNIFNCFVFVYFLVGLLVYGGLETVYAQTIYNQDGYGFSGTITANEVANQVMRGYNSWPSGFTKGSFAFAGGVYDGANIWMIPSNADRVIKMNATTREMTGYDSWPAGFTKGGYAFNGGVYDGTNIWMIPFSADRVIKVNAATGEMTGYSSWPSGFTKGSYAFSGGVYDGTNIWMIPYNADRVIKVNAATGEMTDYTGWPSGFAKSDSAFMGGVFDGTNIWMIPHNANRVIKMNATTGEMTGYTSWPSGFTKGSFAFAGGVYDGANIWMIPCDSDRVIKVNKSTGEMTGYTSWPSGFTKSNAAFIGGAYDGANIWMMPYNADRVIKVNKSTGEMTGYTNWPSGYTKGFVAFRGGVYDGTNVWMIPYDANRVINFGRMQTGILAFSNATYSVAENGTSATITVNRSGGSEGSVTVDYGTNNGTAAAGSDYTAASGTLTFGDGETSKTFAVDITDDAVYEGNEAVNLALSNTTGGATLGAQNTAALTITENEIAQPGTLAFSGAIYSVEENGTSVTITVNRTGGSDESVTVNYATSNGTAISGSDYTSAGGILTFGHGETCKTFTVNISEDAVYEGSETVNLTLSNATGGAVLGAQNTATLTITDNDVAQPGTLAFSNPTYSVSENGTSVTITINRTGGSDGSVTADYATENGTATTGSDYTAAGGTLTFGNGETGKTFAVNITDDAIYEGNETVILTLSNTTGGAVLDAQKTATLTINDNETAQPGTVYSQDGYGFSGTIIANEVLNPVMTGYNSWPSGFTKAKVPG